MKCPYYGETCTTCHNECVLDERQREPISGRLVVQLRDFKCECGVKIATPITPCETVGCKHRRQKGKVFRKTTKVTRAKKVETVGLPTGGFQTTIMGGSLSGEKWISGDLKGALTQHDSAILLVKAVR